MIIDVVAIAGHHFLPPCATGWSAEASGPHPIILRSLFPSSMGKSGLRPFRFSTPAATLSTSFAWRAPSWHDGQACATLTSGLSDSFLRSAGKMAEAMVLGDLFPE
jgi:hypothetical protein